MTAPPVSIAERGTAPADRPSRSSGHFLGEVRPATESARRRRRCPQQEGRLEAAQIRRGHCEDNVGVHAEAFATPTPQGKVTPSPTQDQYVSRARPEVDTDRKSAEASFDILIKQRWIQHLSDLPQSVATTKRWKSGYWHRWFEDVDRNTKDDG